MRAASGTQPAGSGGVRRLNDAPAVVLMRRLAALVLGLVALAGPARAQADRLADLRLATAVRLALVDDVRTRALDIGVAARGGTVTLSGSVPAADRVTVLEVARRVRGVASVDGLGGSSSGPSPAPSVPPSERPSSQPPDRVPASVAGAGTVYHVVARGETLFSLARRYETTVGEVQRLNGMPDASIRVGQRLRMR